MGGASLPGDLAIIQYANPTLVGMYISLSLPADQDGMDQWWPGDVVCAVVKPYIQDWDINMVSPALTP